MARNGNLKGGQQRAIAALLSTATVQDAAKKANVGERTLHRWIKEDDAFRVALSHAEGQMIDAATRRLVCLQEDAITVLQETLTDAAAPVWARLRAATAVLDYLLKLRELRNVEARLAALEAAPRVPDKIEIVPFDYHAAIAPLTRAYTDHEE